MTKRKSLSDQAIEEFSSRISGDQGIPDALRRQLLTLIADGKWIKDVNVSNTLNSFYSIPEGGPDDKT